MYFKKIGFCFITFCLAWMGCKQANSTISSDQKTAETAQTGENPLSNWKVNHVYGSNPDSARTRQVQEAPPYFEVPVNKVKPCSESRRAYMNTGWWHCSAAFQGADTLIRKQYEGKWIKFNTDLTFDILIKGVKTGSGKWAYDEEKNEIFISCKDTYLNNSWAVMEKGFVMIWKGNTELNTMGTQVRVICSKNAPPPIE